MRQKQVLSTLVAVSAALTMLAGCGLSSGVNIGLTTESNTGFDAAATKTLKEGFRNIHMAIFTKIDTNGDGYIDEYEAGPYFNLTHEFPAATRTRNGHSTRISKSEFLRYATAGGLLSGRDTPTAFMQRMRGFLAQVFSKLDKPAAGSGWFSKGDGYLTPDELSDKAVASLGIGFAYDKIHVRVVIPSFDPSDVQAADKTGDGKLSQAEFEDLYMNTVTKLINPNYTPGPSPKPNPAPSVDPNPAPPASGDTPVTPPANVPTSMQWWNF